jgi:glycosidase
MRRIVVVLVVCMLAVAACSSDETVTTTTAAPATTSIAPSTTSAAAATTTTIAPEPAAPWWEGRVFYEVFVRSFQDSDGDGIGDLRGVIDRLDYLNDGDPATTDDLGVTGIWLMPVTEGLSYHGYDVTDYRSVESVYGTRQDFLGLIDAAHERGIAVIVDLVLNHTSRDHPWFQASSAGDETYAGWYLWEESSRGVGWHEAADGRYYFGLFWEGMPDLNLENEAVTAELYDIADFWLDEMGVDGFRLDAVKHYIEDGIRTQNTPATYDWAERFNQHVEATKPDVLTVGEIWSNTTIASTYVPESVDLAFEFDLAEAFIGAAKRGSLEELPRLMGTVVDRYPDGHYAPFLTNHDQVRVASRLDGDVARGKVAASLLLTTAGVPFVYYGEEVGLLGQKPDERIRTPMPWAAVDGAGFTTGEPWQPPSEGIEVTNVADQVADPDSLLAHYRALIHLRNVTPALQSGALTLLDTGNEAVYAVIRGSAADRVLVVVNLAEEPQLAYTLPGVGTIGEQLFGDEWALGAELPSQSTTIVRLP